MKIHQFYDKSLAHASYAIVSEGEIAVVDPERNPKQYFDFAKENNANIIAVIETHPHADFISSHKEIADKTGANIYTSKLVKPEYDFIPFDDGDVIPLGNITLHAINTPGHSPDSISIILKDEKGKEHSVFTGDTLFIGDVGRPDLRESAGNIQAKREELARQMFQSTRNKLMVLPPETIVFPAHGAGSLCGKALSDERSSTIGEQLKENYALKPMNEDEFVDVLLEDQPFIPKYFPNSVELNRRGAPSLEESIKKIRRLKYPSELNKELLVIDTRKHPDFREGHLPNSINIPDGIRFETWLGAIVHPDERFYLAANSEKDLDEMIEKAAKIGYDLNIEAVLTVKGGPEKSAEFDFYDFDDNPEEYTIVDIRNEPEVKQLKIFNDSINIPLPELRERAHEIPTGKPIVVHCAGGYRSAAGASILEKELNAKVFDLAEKIRYYPKD
jgi:hydroxyacylglutathione hydrolase